MRDFDGSILKNIIKVFFACILASLPASVGYSEAGGNMYCNEVVLGDVTYTALQQAASFFIGKTASDVVEGFERSAGLDFSFQRRSVGVSGKSYDFFLATETVAQTFVAFEFLGARVQEVHIRSYFTAGASPDTNAMLSPHCFTDQEGYAAYVMLKFPVHRTNVDAFLSYAEHADLLTHRADTGGPIGEVVLFQGPFPLSSFEADIGGNMSPDLPKGICIVFDTEDRKITSYKKTHTCKIDMALLARQFDTELNKDDL